MSDHVARIHELLAEAEPLGYGATQVGLIEEAVRLADTHGDLELGYLTRKELMVKAMCAGQPDRLLVAFPWCLARCDADPQRFPPTDMLWQFRWVCYELVDFPQVPRAQIDELLADMTRRYEAAGSTLRPVHLLKMNIAVEMGEADEAREHFERFRRAARDWLSDSEVTELAFHINALILFGEDDEVIRKSDPILRGRFGSKHFEGILAAQVLLPLLRRGRGAEGITHHQRGYRLVASNPRHINRVGEHLAFLALTDNLSRAITLLPKHWAASLDVVSQANRFEFGLAVRLVLETLLNHGRERLKIRMPEAFPPYSPAGDYRVTDLKAYVESELNDIAARFDARNGNEHFRRRIIRWAELPRYARAHPLPRRVADE